MHKNQKSILEPPTSDFDLSFRGGSNVLKSNHITRYKYPCPLHLPRSSLRLQTPTNASNRSRPQGQGRADFSTDGTIFMSISRAYRNLLGASDFAHLSAQERKEDKRHTNPLGRTMARITKYPGSTLLQNGKFATKNGLMYIIKRTTSIPLKDGEFAKEEEVYEIACWVAGGAGTENVNFMRDVREKEGAWWRDVRECWFQRGAAVQ